MKVSELMTSDVITLGPDDHLGMAERLMKDSRIRHLPVVDDDFRLVGLITQRDLYKASLSSLHKMDEADSRMKTTIPIRAVMQPEVRTCRATDPLQDVCDVLRHEKFGCMPVVDDEGHLIGIVTDSDFLRLAALFLSKYDGDARGKELVHDAMEQSTPPVADPT